MPVQTLDEFYAAAKIAKPIFEAIVNSIPEVYKICGNHDGDDDKKIIRVTLASSEDERRAQERRTPITPNELRAVPCSSKKPS
jgi:hypothetical protein